MSHEAKENLGTGLRDIFDILVKEPQERLLSLTIQLGESPEDIIIHAICLIILQRETQAMNKLQMLEDHLAKYLAETLQMSGHKLEDFYTQCGHSQELTGASLVVLARIFKVLSEQRLCDSHLRNLAYQRALSTDGHKTSDCEQLEYDQLREEAKAVCGPQFEDWICSSTNLMSGSYNDPHRGQGEGNTTLKVTDPSERAYSLLSPLQASSSMPSYPTHLEISMPPTASFQADKITPEAPDESKRNSHVLIVPGQSKSSEELQPKSNEPALDNAQKDSKMEAASPEERKSLAGPAVQNDNLNQTTKPNTEFALPTATNTFAPKVPPQKEMHESQGAEAEDEAVFYAFVILHAAEDADMAESVRGRIEEVTGCDGATFSEDFDIPGRGTLRCVEDAINNSAFTVLLLTRNFNTRRVELETDTALINSINKKHKHNTVIPLFPRENSLPKQSLPPVLQTITPLEEIKNFDKKLRKFLSPTIIKKQKRIWSEQQRLKSQMEKQDELKRLNQYQKQLIQECMKSQALQREQLNLLMAQKLLLGPSGTPEQHGDDRARWQQQQQQPNIHIENAKYIMIGNDSQMTVDYRGGADEDDSS